jgi:hypothetical protein
VTEGIAFKPGFNPADQGFDDIEQDTLIAASKYLFLTTSSIAETLFMNVHQQLANGADATRVFTSLGITASADDAGEAEDEAQDA